MARRPRPRRKITKPVSSKCQQELLNENLCAGKDIKISSSESVQELLKGDQLSEEQTIESCSSKLPNFNCFIKIVESVSSNCQQGLLNENLPDGKDTNINCSSESERELLKEDRQSETQTVERSSSKLSHYNYLKKIVNPDSLKCQQELLNESLRDNRDTTINSSSQSVQELLEGNRQCEKRTVESSSSKSPNYNCFIKIGPVSPKCPQEILNENLPDGKDANINCSSESETELLKEDRQSETQTVERSSSKLSNYNYLKKIVNPDSLKCQQELLNESLRDNRDTTINSSSQSVQELLEGNRQCKKRTVESSSSKPPNHNRLIKIEPVSPKCPQEILNENLSVGKDTNINSSCESEQELHKENRHSETQTVEISDSELSNYNYLKRIVKPNSSKYQQELLNESLRDKKDTTINSTRSVQELLEGNRQSEERIIESSCTKLPNYNCFREIVKPLSPKYQQLNENIRDGKDPNIYSSSESGQESFQEGGQSEEQTVERSISNSVSQRRNSSSSRNKSNSIFYEGSQHKYQENTPQHYGERSPSSDRDINYRKPSNLQRHVGPSGFNRNIRRNAPYNKSCYRKHSESVNSGKCMEIRQSLEFRKSVSTQKRREISISREHKESVSPERRAKIRHSRETEEIFRPVKRKKSNRSQEYRDYQVYSPERRRKIGRSLEQRESISSSKSIMEQSCSEKHEESVISEKHGESSRPREQKKCVSPVRCRENSCFLASKESYGPKRHSEIRRSRGYRECVGSERIMERSRSREQSGSFNTGRRRETRRYQESKESFNPGKRKERNSSRGCKESSSSKTRSQESCSLESDLKNYSCSKALELAATILTQTASLISKSEVSGLKDCSCLTKLQFTAAILTQTVSIISKL